MRYITISELSKMLKNNLWKIPHDIDLVVGIPRSGLFVASMIALYLNKRLTEIDSFVEGKIFSVGDSRSEIMRFSSIKKILVVEDSISSGASITAAKKKLKQIGGNYEFYYFAPIVTSAGSAMVSSYAEIIDETRIFEWNLFHHSLLEEACIDLDGVLCLDPPIDDDGKQYISYIEHATPLFIPTATIGTIVTCRLEKYRPQTETWLALNNINYHRLIMLDMPNKAARINWGKHGEYKAECFLKYGGKFFIESSRYQAETIAQLSHKDVICIETNSLIPASAPSIYQGFKKGIKTRYPKLFSALKRILKRSIISYF